MPVAGLARTGGSVQVIGSFINIANGAQLLSGAGVGGSAGTSQIIGTASAQGVIETQGGNLNVQNLNLTGATTLDTAGGALVASGNINGAHALTTTTGSGAQTLSGNMGGSTALSTLSTNGGLVTVGNATTTGAQTHTANTFTGTGTLNASTLNVNATTAAALTDTATTGDTVISAPTITLNGNLSSGGNLALNGPVTLSANRSLSAALGLTILGALNAPAHTLTLNAGDDITLGAGASLNGLTLTSADDLFVTGNLAVTSGVDFTTIDDVFILSNSTFSSAGNLLFDSGNTLDGGGFNWTVTGNTLTLPNVVNVNILAATGSSINLNNAISTNGTQTYTGTSNLATTLSTTGDAVAFGGPLNLTGSGIITTAGGTATFQTIDGAGTLTTNLGSGNMVLGGVVGGGTAPTALTITAANTAVNNTLNVGTLAVTGNTQINAAATTSGDATLNGTTVFNAATNIGGDLTVSGASSVAAAITAGGDATLNGPVTLANTISAGDDITINGPATLTANSTLASGGSAGNDVSINNGINGDHTLTLAAGGGNINLAGNVDVDTLSLASGNTLNLGGGTVETDTAQDYTNVGGINLAGDTNLIARDGIGGARMDIITDAANVILATTGGVDLFVYGGNVTLNQVGNTGAGILQSLTINAGVANLLAPIFTTGNQTITAEDGLAGLLSTAGGDVVLNTTSNLLGDVTILSLGGDVFINNTINGGHNLNINAGTGSIFINAALGATTPLAGLMFTADDIVLATTITTAGPQTYNGPITLAGNTGITNTTGNILFASTINGPYNLSLNTSGSIRAREALGGTTPLAGLTITTTDQNVTFDAPVYTDTYTQTSTGGTTSWLGGLYADSIYVREAARLEGMLNGGNARLYAPEIALQLDVRSILLTTASSALTGRVGGLSGKQGARRVGFTQFLNGPHSFGSYALPIADDFFSPPTMQGSPLNPPAPLLSPFTPMYNPNVLYPWETSEELLVVSR